MSFFEFIKKYFEKRKQRKKLEKEFLPYSGFKKELMPVIKKAISDFILRISINSSYVSLGLYDIITENFYKKDVYKFYNNLPDNLSYPVDFSPYLKDFISSKFKSMIYSESHKTIIGAFFVYYLVRLPVLISQCRFGEWSSEKGVSYDNLKEISVYSLYFLEDYFPSIEKKISQESSSKNGIWYNHAIGEEKAKLYSLEDEEMKNLIYNKKIVWEKIYQTLPKLNPDNINNINIFSFYSMVFKNKYNIFWDSYYRDYLDTLRQWDYSGAFKSDTGNFKDITNNNFWSDLEQRINSINYTKTNRNL